MSSQTLYRKYRPTTFADVIGQDPVVQTLRREIETGKVSHAYVFSGPRGVGKTTIARIVARSLNCIQRVDSEPCGKCASCMAFTQNRHPDVLEIDAASNRGIDEIRELKKIVRYGPQQGKYKIVIIDEAHMLTAPAFNALLKTLEEPPSYLVFILATTEIHDLPATILSRTQRFDFKKVALPVIVAHLQLLAQQEKIAVDDEVLQRIARASEGCVRDAVSILGQVLILDDKKITAEMVELVLPSSHMNMVWSLVNSMAEKNTIAGLQLVDDLVEQGIDIEQFIKDSLSLVRLFLLVQQKSPIVEEYFSSEELEKAKKISGVFGSVGLLKIIDIFLDAFHGMTDTPVYQLPLEIAICTWAEEGSSASQLHSFSASQAGGSVVVEKTAEVKKEVPVTQVVNTVTIDQNTLVMPNEVSRIESVVSIAPPQNAVAGKVLEQVKKYWDDFVASVSQKNRSLPFILKVCKPTGEREGMVILSFKYKLQFEKAKTEPIRSLLEQVMSEVVGEPVRITHALDSDLILENSTPHIAPVVSGAPQTADAALAAFGGEMV